MEALFVQALQGLGISVLSILCVFVLISINKEWLIARLTKSIEHEYATKLEEYKYQVEVKKKAELVAKLLAHWINSPEDKEELNRMTFECYLWLPDDLAKDLADLFAYERKEEVTVKAVLIKIRRHLNNGAKGYDKLNNDDLTHFRITN